MENLENPFSQGGLDIDGMLHILEFEKDFTNFLLDIQANYRIQRAMSEDKENYLLNGTRVIDDIISRIPELEKAREQYFAKQKEDEKENIKKQLAKQK